LLIAETRKTTNDVDHPTPLEISIGLEINGYPRPSSDPMLLR
jgi:hypothetical protein